jgi:hypothetical protein
MHEIASETSSMAGGITPVVAADAAELASLSVDPIPARSVTAADIISGTAVRKDTLYLHVCALHDDRSHGLGSHGSH